MVSVLLNVSIFKGKDQAWFIHHKSVPDGYHNISTSMSISIYSLLNVPNVYSSFIQIHQYNKNKFLYMISSLTILHWCQNPCLLCHKNHNFSRILYGFFFNIQSVCMHCQQKNRFLILYSNILYDLFGPTLL